MSQTGSASKPVQETQQAVHKSPEPQAEHRWLQKLVGEWTYETEHEGVRATGTERGRSIGGLWVQLEGTGQMPGTSDPTTSVMTLGFDTATRRFTGTFVASMMTHQWLYDGALDTANDRLTLTSAGPSMTDEGKTALYQDVIEFQSDEQRTLTASMQQPDGTWQQFMIVSYRRTSRG
jgi:hypothetical protein